MKPAERSARVLVVDDKVEMAEMLADGLADHGFVAVACSSSRKAAALLEQEGFDALVTDLRMPELDGIELLSRSLTLNPERPVIVMTAYGAVDTAIESIRRGASHYVTKPFKIEEVALFLTRALDQATLRREARALRQAARARSPLLGSSQSMQRVVEVARQVARSVAPVLILGETGTGKNVVARLIHDESARASGPFVAVNCAALPEALLESELFGHARGAFTGATSAREGLFVEASGGTLLLDEIGDMPLSLQAKLLHVLERAVVRPVGSNREQPVDVRLLAATHRDLRDRVRKGAFREDLLYRLEVVPIELPPLRDRREDIPELVEHFVKLYRERHPGSRGERVSARALAQMLASPWPGNVRELAHAVERMVVLATGPEMDAAPGRPGEPQASQAGLPTEIVTMREAQRRYAVWAYERLGRNRQRAAERLGIDPKTLGRLLSEASPDGHGGRGSEPDDS